MRQVSEALFYFATPGALANTPARLEMKQIHEWVMTGAAYLPSQGNHVHVRAPSSGPVQLFAIVGDTGGPDISTDENPKDDTRIDGIRFRPIQIRLR